MTGYTPRQILFFRHTRDERKGGSLKDGTANVMRLGKGGTHLCRLVDVPAAELEIRARLPGGGVMVRPDDDAHLFVRGVDGRWPPLAKLAAFGSALVGKRKMGVRELVDAAVLRERWPLMAAGVRVFEIVDAADGDTDVSEPVPEVEAPCAEHGGSLSECIGIRLHVHPLPEPAETVRAGRADHHERRTARVARLEHGAERARAEAKTAFAGVERIASMIPMGQPILVGHHSEKHHRRDIARIQGGMRRGVEAQKTAAELERAAATAERNDTIRADDPEALVLLRAKLAELQLEREQIKATNAACRKGDEFARARVRQSYGSVSWHDLNRGCPPFVLTNLSANIRRVEGRIVALERERTAPERAPVEQGGWSMVENTDTNRVEIRSPGARRSTTAEYKQIRAHGFVWARTVGAFTRILNANAWAAGERLLASLSHLGTPAAAQTIQQ